MRLSGLLFSSHYIKDYSNYLFNLTSPNFTERLDRQNIEERQEHILGITRDEEK
ncbi:hypothetical protein [Trichococcus shcherbakoviae]|uniref:hypothetical protein n=1 Tax=Trichococcus shcherbakoviae TaxID=2094020 RepID=UPI0029F58737|nr:hypothetical protein [Trichococcus shcherbakoviae]